MADEPQNTEVKQDDAPEISTETSAPKEELKIKTVSMDEKSRRQKLLALVKRKKFYLPAAVVLVMIIGLVVVLAGSGNTTKEDAVASEEIPAYTSAKVTLIEGSLDKLVDEKYVELKVDDEIKEKDQLRTSGVSSRVTIELDNESIVRLDGDTEVTVESLSNGQIVFKLTTGQIYSRVNPDAPGSHAINTENGSFRATGTAYKTTDNGDEESNEVYEGTVYEESSSSSINEGQKMYIKNNQDDSKEGKTENLDIEEVLKDDFVLWNREQDAKTDKYKDSLGFLYDVEGPTLTINSPTNNSSVIVQSEIVVDFSGVTEAEAEVSVNNLSNSSQETMTVKAGTDGAFEIKSVPGIIGKNSYELTAKDRVGNKTKKIVTVNYSNKSNGSTAPSGSILLKGLGFLSEGKYTVAWSLGDGFAEGEGYKVVWNTTGDPKFPDDNPIFVENGTYQAEIPFSTTEGATLYVKVCRYDGEKCNLYSNSHSKYIPASE